MQKEIALAIALLYVCLLFGNTKLPVDSVTATYDTEISVPEVISTRGGTQHFLHYNTFPGILTRIRFKHEMRFENRRALLNSIALYYGTFITGPLYNIEYRKYNRPGKMFFYTKLGGGYTIYQRQRDLVYATAGLGVGQQIHFKNKSFILEFSQGLQLPIILEGYIDFILPPVFLMYGGGAPINLQMNIIQSF